MPIEQRHIELFRDRFVSRPDAYCQQLPDGSYISHRSPVSDSVIEGHLKGRISIALYALSSESKTQSVVLDADRRAGVERLQEACKKLNQRGIPAQLELSREGRGHAWIFFEPIAAPAAQRLVRAVLPELGDHIELFPKQRELRPGQLGNAVRAPLGIHRLTGKRYPFVDPVSLIPVSKTVSGTIEFLSAAPRLSVAEAANVLALLLDEAKNPPKPRSRLRVFPGDEQGRTHVDVNELKARIGDPFAFISQYVDLNQYGRGSCPFHPPDNRPSFAVNREQGYWVCFHETNPRTGGFIGGDAIDFYKRLNNLSYREALTQLWSKYGGDRHDK